MILHLNLKKEWFDRHLLDKNDDYREVTPYWLSKFVEVRVIENGKSRYELKNRKWWSDDIVRKFNVGILSPSYIIDGLCSGQYKFIVPDTVIYSNGMKPLSVLPRFEKQCLGILIGFGNTYHGAPENEQVFIIRGGKVLYKLNC